MTRRKSLCMLGIGVIFLKYFWSEVGWICRCRAHGYRGSTILPLIIEKTNLERVTILVFYFCYKLLQVWWLCSILEALGKESAFKLFHIGGWIERLMIVGLQCLYFCWLLDAGISQLWEAVSIPWLVASPSSKPVMVCQILLILSFSLTSPF